MNIDKLRELIRQQEHPKLEFKRDLYSFNDPESKIRGWQWNEFIKDILALTNGNVGTAYQIAYLIIGVGDELKGDTRELRDVGDFCPTAQQMIDKVNSACEPPLPDLSCKIVEVEGQRILAISIPPSPYLHETRRPIQTSRDKTYPERTVFVRRGEGIFPASETERRRIAKEKESANLPIAADDGSTSSPRVQLTDDDWTHYCNQLAQTLRAEIKKHRVPVDIVCNRVQEFQPWQNDPRPSRGKPWLEVAISQRQRPSHEQSTRQHNERTVILLGEAGEGKTVCFTALAIELLAKRHKEPDTPIPVLVRLFNYNPPENTLEELIAQQLSLHGLTEVGPGNVAHLLSKCHFVLLDGLNEVEDPEPLISDINKLTRKAPESRYFLSCRKAVYDDLREYLVADKVWQLVPFRQEDIEELLAHLFETDTDLTRHPRGWLEDARMVEVLGNPFFLSLFVSLHPVMFRSPQNRAELCQAFVVELERREKVKARGMPAAFSSLTLMLETIAFRMQEQHQTYLSTDEGRELAREIRHADWAGQEPKVSWAEMQTVLESYPLLKYQLGQVAFTHQLFQDFFAASTLAKRMDTSNDELFKAYLNDPWWHYSIVLLCGLRHDSSEVLHHIGYAWTAYSLAIDCLFEAPPKDARAIESIVRLMRQAQQFDELWKLGPVIALLPKEAEAWCEQEARAIVEAALETDQPWGYALWSAWQALRERGWPITEEMVFQAAASGRRSDNDTRRGNSLPILASRGQWETVLQLMSDPSSYVREMVGYTISKIEGGDHATLLHAARQLAEDHKSNVRQQAMEAASKLVTFGGLDILKEGLRDSNAEVWQAALDELVKGARGQDDQVLAQVVPVLTQRLEELQHVSGEQSEEHIDKLLSALAKVDTDESSNALFVAMLRHQASPAFVASVLARRGDPRAVRAVLLDLALEMIEFPEEYVDTPWRDFIFTGKELPESRKEFVEAELGSLFGRPFKLGWLESLLIPEETTDASLGYDSVFEELSRLCRSNREALSLLLWVCLIAWGEMGKWTEPTDSLLDATIWHLIEIDPTVLVEFITDPARSYLLWPSDEFAARMLRTTAILTSLLPDERRKDLLNTYAD